jgi:hypothetical protein
MALALACSSNPASPPPAADQNAEPAADPAAPAANTAAPAANIAIDGSSTVYPITEAVAEEFQKGKDVRVTIGVSGTGGGFKKFCKGEVAIAGASRPIKPSEVELCKGASIDYTDRYAHQMEETFKGIPEMNRFFEIVGFNGVTSAIGFVGLKDWGERDRSAQVVANLLFLRSLGTTGS